MHARLTQIMGIHSNTAIFGNVGIIAIGDFYQCSPVVSSSIYSSLLWSDHFEYIELKINERQKKNFSFSQMLNRIRKLKKKENMNKEDHDIVEKCHQRYLNKECHAEAVHLFAKNVQVDKHNEEMIEKICINIRTFYEVDSNNKEIKENESKNKKVINKPLRLARNARVMITKNICVNDGLANGVTGHVGEFVESNNTEVSHIIMKCDSPTIGRLHRVSCSHCHGRDTICVTRESDIIDRQDFVLQSKKAVKQFPLHLSWAMTIHKAQGITVDQVVISTKDLFGSGMGYTALSRVRTLEGLFIIDLYFEKFYCNENVDRVLSQMKEMKRKPSIFQESSNFLNIFFHNIEGLKCNFNAFRQHHLIRKADFICLAETWLKNNNEIDKLELDGYKLLHKTRLSSFESNHPLHSQKGGGVAIYFRKEISIKKIDSCKHLNLEYITFEVEKNSTTIIICYRSPQQSKNEFLINLTEHLEQISIQKHILLIGDLNEDTLSNKSKPIEIKLQSLGFTNIFKRLPTTNSLSSIDCIYSNFISNKDQYYDVAGTYYSFHDALILSVNIENGKSKPNIENELINEITMETNNSFQTSSEVVKISKQINKRKEISRKRTNNQPLKRTKITTNDISTNSGLKEKQLLFLRNVDKTMDINSLEYLSNTLSLIDQLATIGLKKINILGDGNCFFRAISHQLYRHENDHLNIRSETISYLISNKNDFEPFIDETDSTIENYIE
ncbi:unnamed protein product [Rotaria sordida]|uniref:OTU domain-containing protein n=1 Tax=Rotaria sordida TaxID=392033 RepID=A0A819EY78_9BILA|nr:unnamed protein product [Rotaria sordida]